MFNTCWRSPLLLVWMVWTRQTPSWLASHWDWWCLVPRHLNCQVARTHCREHNSSPLTPWFVDTVAWIHSTQTSHFYYCNSAMSKEINEIMDSADHWANSFSLQLATHQATITKLFASIQSINCSWPQKPIWQVFVHLFRSEAGTRLRIQCTQLYWIFNVNLYQLHILPRKELILASSWFYHYASILWFRYFKVN